MKDFFFIIVTRDLFNKNRTIILYIGIGLLSASIDFLIFTLLMEMGFKNYLLANIIGIHCGIFSSFFLNRTYNFKVKDNFFKRAIIFYLVGVSGLITSSILLWFFVENIGWQIIFSKAITFFVIFLLQFTLNRFITFKKAKNEKNFCCNAGL